MKIFVVYNIQFPGKRMTITAENETEARLQIYRQWIKEGSVDDGLVVLDIEQLMPV